MTGHDEDHPLAGIVQPVTTEAYRGELGVLVERRKAEIVAKIAADVAFAFRDADRVRKAQQQAICEDETCTAAGQFWSAIHAGSAA